LRSKSTWRDPYTAMESRRERPILANSPILNMSRSSITSLKNKCVISAIKSQFPTGFFRNMNISISCVAGMNRNRKNTSTTWEECWEDDRLYAITSTACSSSTAGILVSADCLLLMTIWSAGLGDANQVGLRYSSAWDPKWVMMVVLHGHPKMILSQRRINTTSHDGVLTGSAARRSTGYSAYATWKRQKQSTSTY